MSSDRRRKVDPSDLVEEPRALVVDSTEPTSKNDPQENIPRRRKANSGMYKGPYGHLKRYIPAGYVGRVATTFGGQTERLYAEDWDFAVDEDNNRIFATSTTQTSKDGDVKHVLMIKRKEYYEADMREKANLRKKSLGIKSSNLVTVANPHDPFYNDIGLVSDDS